MGPLSITAVATSIGLGLGLHPRLGRGITRHVCLLCPAARFCIITYCPAQQQGLSFLAALLQINSGDKGSGHHQILLVDYFPAATSAGVNFRGRVAVALSDMSVDLILD